MDYMVGDKSQKSKLYLCLARVFPVTIFATDTWRTGTAVVSIGVCAVRPVLARAQRLAFIDVDIACFPFETRFVAVTLEAVDQIFAGAIVARIVGTFVNVLLTFFASIAWSTAAVGILERGKD